MGNWFSNHDVTERSTPSSLSNTGKDWLHPQYHDEDCTKIKKPDELKDIMISPPHPIDQKLLDRIQGSLIGLALGDALGAHVEFRPRQYLLEHRVTDLKGGGTWGLKEGQFTDDTSMALCLAISLIVRCDFQPYDQLVRYKWWYRNGYMSSTGQCFDIGAATSQSLREFERRQEKFAQKNKIPLEDMDLLSDEVKFNKFDVYCSNNYAAGNGGLMRFAPVPLFFRKYPIEAVEYSGTSAKITHGDEKAYDACRLYGALIVAALNDETKNDLLHEDFYEKHKEWFSNKPLHADIMKIARGSYKTKKNGYDDGIRGKGYVVDCLEAALWAFSIDEDSFEKGVLAAVNLGDDADTTAAIYGQLAGAYYGFQELPQKWVKKVYAGSFINCISEWIVYEGQAWYERKTATVAVSQPSSQIQSNTTISATPAETQAHHEKSSKYKGSKNSKVHVNSSPKPAEE